MTHSTPTPYALGWLGYAMSPTHLVHVIGMRGYEVCVAVIGAQLTLRAFPVMHGPKTEDGCLGWDPIDKTALPRDL